MKWILKMKFQLQTQRVTVTCLHLSIQLNCQPAVIMYQLIMIMYQLTIMIMYQLTKMIMYQLIMIMYQLTIVIMYQLIAVDVRVLAKFAVDTFTFDASEITYANASVLRVTSVTFANRNCRCLQCRKIADAVETNSSAVICVTRSLCIYACYYVTCGLTPTIDRSLVVSAEANLKIINHWTNTNITISGNHSVAMCVRRFLRRRDRWTFTNGSMPVSCRSLVVFAAVVCGSIVKWYFIWNLMRLIREHFHKRPSIYDIHTISPKFDPPPLSTCIKISLYPIPHRGRPQKFQLCQAKVSAFIKYKRQCRQCYLWHIHYE